MYPTAGMFVVRADSPYHRIADLKGKPIAFGAKGSGLTLLARYVLDGIGLDAEKDFQAITLDKAGDGPAMVLDGRAAALWGGGNGWPGFTAVANSKEGARFIAPDAGRDRPHPGQARFPEADDAPAGGYPGPDRADPVGRLLELRDGAPRPRRGDGLPSRPRAAQSRGPLAKRPQLAETTAANTLAARRRPAMLHPGVARYFKEIGLAK